MGDRNIKEMVLLAEGISCAACALDMENILKETEGIVDVSVSFADEKIRIRYNSDLADRKKVFLAVRRLGYNVKILSEEA